MTGNYRVMIADIRDKHVEQRGRCWMTRAKARPSLVGGSIGLDEVPLS